MYFGKKQYALYVRRTLLKNPRPVVPAAFAVNYARPDLKLAIFILNYIAMVPTANLIGFAGQELARKLPKVFGMIYNSSGIWRITELMNNRRPT